MADKLSSRQHAMLAVLNALPTKFGLINRLIEEIAGPRPDESTSRRLVRVLDEAKGGTSAVGLSGLTQTLGQMAMMARRTGGHQMKIRGLREGLGSLRVNLEGALREARRPEREAVPEAPKAGKPGP
jgi:hypothetical protein